MLESPVALQFRKNVPIGEAMLIWGREGWQTMMTGAKDPVSFYMQIKTETYGKAKIVKTSEDGIVEGIPFTRNRLLPVRTAWCPWIFCRALIL